MSIIPLLEFGIFCILAIMFGLIGLYFFVMLKPKKSKNNDFIEDNNDPITKL